LDTAEFQKSYKKDGKTGYTNSFGIGDLLELAECANRTHDRLMERRQERYREGQSR
jgi:hypothetical protein